MMYLRRIFLGLCLFGLGLGAVNFAPQAQAQASCNQQVRENGFCSSWPTKRAFPGMEAHDLKRGLKIDGLGDLGFVTNLKPGTNLPDPGLYIYVFKSDGNLLIRRSDRPGDKGCFDQGNIKYSYAGNPPYQSERPHAFVRHTQLNGGYHGVFGSGMLEIISIEGRPQVAWISNNSGHFRPDPKSLDYVREALRRGSWAWSKMRIVWKDGGRNTDSACKYIRNALPAAQVSKIDAEIYWSRYPDVAASPEFGRSGPSGYGGARAHFLKHGQREGRKWGL